MTAWRARPEKPYGKFEYYKNGGADEIIFVFKGGGIVETVFGKQRYRAEDYIVIPRGITYRLVPDKVEEEDYLILESAGPVRIPKRYLNQRRANQNGFALFRARFSRADRVATRSTRKKTPRFW